MRELRPSLSVVVKNVREGRRPYVTITSNGMPVAALVPVHRDGTLDVVHALEVEANPERFAAARSEQRRREGLADRLDAALVEAKAEGSP